MSPAHDVIVAGRAGPDGAAAPARLFDPARLAAAPARGART